MSSPTGAPPVRSAAEELARKMVAGWTCTIPLDSRLLAVHIADLTERIAILIQPYIASVSSAPAGQGEALRDENQMAYNAAEIAAIQHELIGPVEYERLGKTPWARSLVHSLVQRIANLRFNVIQLTRAAPASPVVNGAWWCCSADYPDHDTGCANATSNPAPDTASTDAPDKGEVARLKAARDSAPAAWQPISTAPKDGTILLLWWPYWSARAVEGFWNRTKGEWQSERKLSDGPNPTHWQPLPAPPAPPQEGQP